MGNRANIVCKQTNRTLYVHWNGGPESVIAAICYAMEEMDATPGNLLDKVSEIYKRAFNQRYEPETDEPTICAADNGDFHIRWSAGTLPQITIVPGDYHCHEQKGHYSLWELIALCSRDNYWTGNHTIFDLIQEKLRAVAA